MPSARRRRIAAWLERSPALVLAVVGGVTFALTSPPTDLYPATVLGMALLAAALSDAPTTARAFGRGVAWGTAAGIVGLRFVPSVIQRFTPLGVGASYLSLVLLAAGQSLIWAIGAAVFDVVRRRAKAPFEIAFACCVLCALSLPTIFAWSPAGLVSRWPVLVQLADLVGERGVSVIFAVVAALLARGALAATGRRPGDPLDHAGTAVTRAALLSPEVLRPTSAALAILGVLAAHGYWRMADVAVAGADLPTVRIGLIDQAVGPHERWKAENHPAILHKLRELTRRAEAQGSELTIWPEAAYPYPLEHDATRAPSGALAPIGRGVSGPLLIGMITRDRPTVVEAGRTERNSHNSATVVARDGSVQPPYDKMQLLWFGEMVPGGAQLPWLRRIFQKSGGLLPGSEPRALHLARAAQGAPDVHMAVLNCYEDTLPGVGRLLDGALQPNLLVNITNDAWFFGTAESELHARLATMRAVELRLDLVRAVNMGVVTWVDASGSIRARYDGADPTVLMVTPALRDAPPTPYSRFGDAPLCGVLVSLVLAFALRHRRRQSVGADPAGPGAARPRT